MRWHVRSNPAIPDLCGKPVKKRSIYTRLVENVTHEQVGIGRDYDTLEWKQKFRQYDRLHG